MDKSPKPSSAEDAEEEKSARRALAGVPGFTPREAEEAQLSRLFGLTNRVYAVEAGGRRYCLRLPGVGSDAIIDRRVEEANARRAAAAGVAPEVLYFGADGVMLTAFVEGAEPLTREHLAARPGAIERTASALRKLHYGAMPFERDYDPFATMSRYVELLDRKSAAGLHEARDSLEALANVRSALASRPVTRKPCHCDPTGRNLLDDGDRVWLVDWEYSGQNDPAWDLAYFSVESALDEGGDLRLLTAYHGRAPTAAEAARVAVTKAVCEVLAAVWALVQAAQGNRVADFETYARETFAAAAERMESKAFAGEMAALLEG